MTSLTGEKFEWLTAAKSTITRPKPVAPALNDDLENRSQRVNLCILNIPEGGKHGRDPLKFMLEVSMQAMGPSLPYVI